jgi:hypothetical protein
MSSGSIKIYVGVTDLDWFEFLSARDAEEVNFWQPGGRSQCGAAIRMRCARTSWRVPAGESPARVRGSSRPVVSVAAWAVTTTAKRTQQSCGAWE